MRSNKAPWRKPRKIIYPWVRWERLARRPWTCPQTPEHYFFWKKTQKNKNFNDEKNKKKEKIVKKNINTKPKIGIGSNV